MSKVYDAVIVGGGPAGLAVATGLARLCHSALVIDSGNYRNGRSTHIHNVVGFDHQNPAEFRRKARADIASRYDTIDFRDTSVTQVRKTRAETFEAIDNMGTIYTGRKLVLAMGVRDVMLPIDGYAECWTRGIFHCLFCQGFEHRGVSSCGLIAEGVCSDSPMAVHTGRMALQFSESLTIYTHGSVETAGRLRAAIPDTETAIRIDTRRIANLSMIEPGRSRIVLEFEDGTQATEGFLVSPNTVSLLSILDLVFLTML